MSEFGKYVMAKTASKVVAEARAFFEELAEAQNKRPIYINGQAIGFFYTTRNGEKKAVSREEILSNAKRMKTGALIAKNIIEQL